jgi:hypothetical protein
MTSIIKVDTIQDQDGNNIINENADTITIGASGDTITIPAGATIDASGATVTLPTTIEVDAVEPQSGTTLTLGASGDTVSVPTGATLDVTNATVTGLPASGKLLQAVTATDSTTRTTSSTSFVTVSNTLSVSITPSSASNKIFLIASGSIYNTTGSVSTIATIFRDATDLGAASNKGLTLVYTPYNNDIASSMCMSVLDSPNTTSAITYQVYFRASAGSASLNFDGNKGSITAFEIQG